MQDVSEKFGFDNIHIFTLPSDAGFVIVAGSESMHPILGYSFESPLTQMGDNMRAWLRLWDDIRPERTVGNLADEWQALEDGDPVPMMSSGSGGIPALMATRWNQSPLYNDSCPYDATAQSRALTGCVATAMAQVMAYWKRPLNGQGQHSYTHTLYGLQHANFGATAYDWTNMPYILDASSTAAEIRAEAQLVYHCGVAVEMGYGVEGSSAYVSSYGDPAFPSAENALRDHFRFKPSLHSIFESNMTQSQWLDSIKAEIFAGRPIVFAGFQGNGGHAYVIDGYDQFDRVHVNWGWGGYGDGYFTLCPLPMYSSDCQAVVGIQPDAILYGNKTSLAFDENGGADTVTIFTNSQLSSSWTAYSNRSWISVSPTSGAGGGAQASVAIVADSNLTGQNRSGNVIIRQGNDSINIPIIQYGYNGEDQVLPEDDTIAMSVQMVDPVPIDTIIPGVHYTILDPGGTAPYPNTCNSRIHLYVDQRSAIIMDLDYDLNPGSDWLRLYNSDGEQIEIAYYSGTDSNIRHVFFSGHAFISFHSDTYTPRSGFVIHIYACDTFEAEVRNVVSVVSGTNTITLNWIDTSSADQWRIKWGTNPNNLDQYREVYETTARFTNLDLDRYQYYFRIYNNAGAADTGNLCLSRLMMGMAQGDFCPGSSIKDHELAQVLNHSVTIRWRDISHSDDTPMHWHVRYGTSFDSLDLLAQTDSTSITLTGLQNNTTYYYRIYNNTVSHDSASACFLMPIQHFTTLECLWDSMDIRDIVLDNVTDTSVDVSWTDYGGATHWNLRLFLDSDSLLFDLDTPYVHIGGLERGRYYDFVIYNNTGQTDTTTCRQHHGLSTLCLQRDDEKCINFTDLNTCLVETFSGYYDSPDIWAGSVDYGSGNPSSRHTVIHDPQPDSLTGNALMMIPPGHTASVRLGNSLAGREAESISYLYTIDTANFDLLILKYAAVLENPGHDHDQQPRFTLRIVDRFDQPIDDSCYLFDFVADSNLGWNTYGRILWKDWTTVGVDLTPLHGQTIKVKLTTRDCNQGTHFGYAYFTLQCGNKQISADLCGSSRHNTFRVPQGFSYRWFEASNPAVTLSTADTLTVDTAGDYRCTLSPLGNTGGSCSFDMLCRAGYRFPHSDFSYLLTDTVGCLQRIHFTNLSVLATDAEGQNLLHDTISDILWDFGDGNRTSVSNPDFDFAHGQHSVTLVSYMNGATCTDTLVLPILVQPVCPVADTLYDTICEGDTVLFYDTPYTGPGVYDFRDGLWWHTLILSVIPTAYVHIRDTIVQNQLPYSFVDTLFDASMLDPDASHTHFSALDTLTGSRGCDSVAQLSLVVWHNRQSHTDTALCRERLPLHWNGQSAYGPTTLTAPLHTTHGADSTATLTIHLYDSPQAALSVSPEIVTIDNHERIQLKDLSTGSSARLWILPDQTSDAASWIYSYPISEDSVLVTLVAISSHACADTATALLRLLNTTLYAPTAFTPDEAQNNHFKLHGRNLLELEVYLYNRWGNLVSSWKGIEGSWDGTYNGQPCPIGNYVWIAHYRTADAPRTPQTAKGSVLLIR